MSDDLPFLTDEEGIEPAEVEAQPEATEPKGEPELAAPPAAPPEDAKSIPLTALLDEREKRQRVERERDEMARIVQSMQAAQKPEARPDFYADPDAAIAEVEARASRAAIATKLETSRFLAEREFGADEVKAAYAFFDENPHLSHQLLQNPSPYHEAVNVYRRHRAVQEIGGDPEAFKTRMREQLRAELLAELTTTTPKAPPPSMAASPGAGTGKAAPVSGFDALFQRD